MTVVDPVAEWVNPREYDGQRSAPIREVEFTFSVQSNLSEEELVARLEEYIVGGTRKSHGRGGVETTVPYGRMPRWIRSVTLDGIFDDEDKEDV